jgi:hypothetical protein
MKDKQKVSNLISLLEIELAKLEESVKLKDSEKVRQARENILKIQNSLQQEIEN